MDQRGFIEGVLSDKQNLHGGKHSRQRKNLNNGYFLWIHTEFIIHAFSKISCWRNQKIMLIQKRLTFCKASKMDKISQIEHVENYEMKSYCLSLGSHTELKGTEEMMSSSNQQIQFVMRNMQIVEYLVRLFNSFSNCILCTCVCVYSAIIYKIYLYSLMNQPTDVFLLGDYYVKLRPSFQIVMEFILYFFGVHSFHHLKPTLFNSLIKSLEIL